MIQNTIGEKIIYTALKDLLDISFEKKGLDNQDTFKDIIDSIAKEELGKAVSIKKPATKKESSTKKVKTTRPPKKTIEQVQYKWNKLEDGYEYCEEIQFADGAYAIRDVVTKDIIGAINNDGSRDLTFNDKTVLAKLTIF